eukprot:RCo020202
MERQYQLNPETSSSSDIPWYSLDARDRAPLFSSFNGDHVFDPGASKSLRRMYARRPPPGTGPRSPGGLPPLLSSWEAQPRNSASSPHGPVPLTPTSAPRTPLGRAGSMVGLNHGALVLGLPRTRAHSKAHHSTANRSLV